MYYQVFQGTGTQAGQWRWRLVAGNNRIIANSGESYWNKADCLHAIDLVKGSTNTAVYEA